MPRPIGYHRLLVFVAIVGALGAAGCVERTPVLIINNSSTEIQVRVNSFNQWAIVPAKTVVQTDFEVTVTGLRATMEIKTSNTGPVTTVEFSETEVGVRRTSNMLVLEYPKLKTKLEPLDP